MESSRSAAGTFTKENSQALKGVAILMMLWHHCYLSGRYDGYTINFWPIGENRAVRIAVFCKMCVSLFAFISGYGLYLNHREKPDVPGTSGGWLTNRLYTTMKSYWFVVVLSWIVGLLIHATTQSFYFGGGVVYGLWRMLTDFLGVTAFFGDAGMMFNSTWWYMSAAIVYILVLPLLAAGLKKWGTLVVLGAVFLLTQTHGYGGGVSPSDFLLAFAFGAAFAHGGWFARWHDVCAKRRTLMFLLSAAVVAACFKLNWNLPAERWWNVKYAVIPVAVILFLKEYIISIPGLRQVLCYLGRHATNIFLVHTFIRWRYCEALTYSWGKYSFAAVILFLLATSLLLSYVITFLKKITRYDSGMEKLRAAFVQPAALGKGR